MKSFARAAFQQFLKHLPHALGVAILIAAVYFLWNDLHHLDRAKIFAQIQALSPAALVAAIILTFLNFFVLTFYDVLALKHTGHPLPYHKVAVTAFIAYVFSGNLGFSILTGGAVRYRFYTRWGVKPKHIAHMMVFSAITLGLGLFTLAGFALICASPTTFPHLPVSSTLLDIFGALLLTVVAGYLWLCRTYHKPFTFKGLTLSLPPLKLSLLQIGISILDWFIAAAVLYTLFIGSVTDLPISPHTFLIAFLIAQIAGVNSHVPGGVGVFDGLILLLLKPYIPLEEILGVLLAYRAIYYLMPFVVSLVLFAVAELRYGFHKPKPKA